MVRTKKINVKKSHKGDVYIYTIELESVDDILNVEVVASALMRYGVKAQDNKDMRSMETGEQSGDFWYDYLQFPSTKGIVSFQIVVDSHFHLVRNVINSDSKVSLIFDKLTEDTVLEIVSEMWSGGELDEFDSFDIDYNEVVLGFGGANYRVFYDSEDGCVYAMEECGVDYIDRSESDWEDILSTVEDAIEMVLVYAKTRQSCIKGKDNFYWKIDVSSGCEWGYSFSVKTKADCDDRRKVIEASKESGLFKNEYDWCGCGVNLLGDDELDRAWRDNAYEIEF